jgi:enoyl-CoA hydratase/carnithine racemase
MEYRLHNRVGVVTFSQPPSNSMTMDFFDGLKESLDKIRKEKPHAVIITGSGRHFSAGADIDELLTVADEYRMSAHYETYIGFENLECPVISAIRGVCLGAAFELTLFSHFRLCTKDAVFGLPEATFNLMPGLGGIGKVTHISGKAIAIDLAIRGGTFTAEDAFSYGLVDGIVEKKELMPLALKFAASLPTGKPIANRVVYIQKYLKSLLENE